MSRFARRNLPALLVVAVLALLPATAAQARPSSHIKSTDNYIYEPIDLHGLMHHLWTGFLSLWGADGAQMDPNGSPKHS